MKKQILFYILLPFSLLAEVNGDKDFQIWNINGLNIRLSPKSSFYGELQLRYGDDASKLYYKHTHVELNWNLNHLIAITPGIRFISLRLNNRWLKENDPLVKLTFSFINSRHITIANRSWLQYGNLPDETNQKRRFLYRNRLHFLFPCPLGYDQMRLYLSDEIFCQQMRGIIENRAIIGVSIPRNQRVFFDIFYDYRAMKTLENTWVRHNIFGGSVQFHF